MVMLWAALSLQGRGAIWVFNDSDGNQTCTVCWSNWFLTKIIHPFTVCWKFTPVIQNFGKPGKISTDSWIESIWALIFPQCDMLDVIWLRTATEWIYIFTRVASNDRITVCKTNCIIIQQNTKTLLRNDPDGFFVPTHKTLIQTENVCPMQMTSKYDFSEWRLNFH